MSGCRQDTRRPCRVPRAFVLVSKGAHKLGSVLRAPTRFVRAPRAAYPSCSRYVRPARARSERPQSRRRLGRRLLLPLRPQAACFVQQRRRLRRPQRRRLQNPRRRRRRCPQRRRLQNQQRRRRRRRPSSQSSKLLRRSEFQAPATVLPAAAAPTAVAAAEPTAAAALIFKFRTPATKRRRHAPAATAATAAIAAYRAAYCSLVCARRAVALDINKDAGARRV